MDSQIKKNEIDNEDDIIYKSETKHYKFIAEIGKGSGGFVTKVERLQDKKL